ncbi:SWIM zinc finger family protein [Wenjunlia vitaminophila]|uniref:SWIM zinc finger family protein n=1 Tax=Wenjunlia vitaminophila TaxID=76728 RepID=UPI000998C855|nr:SWIM zinc finger family protein [Wenjunlia vitaminophila]
MEERWTAEQVLALAPDAASRKAAGKLSAPGPWSGTGTAVLADGAGTAVWGLCRGSGSKPYQTVVDLDAPAYKCSCPSRKFPCKHALGLLVLWSAGADAGVAPAEPPEWVAQWADGRRSRAEQKAVRAATGPADEAGARRRAERRARQMAEGAGELERRLADQLRAGLAGADREGYGVWDEVAARMVDAKAPGLASRARNLAVVPSTGAGWPSRTLQEFGLLHLLVKGLLAVDGLPEPLAATVRSRAGVPMDTADVLRVGESVRDLWVVLGQEDAQDSKLTTRRLWLQGTTTGRAAMVLSFGAAGRAPELTLPTGLSIDADLTYFPGARPLRAAIGERHGPPVASPVPHGVPVGQALDRYAEALVEDPWLDSWPTVLADVVPIPGPEGWQLADASGDEALPVTARFGGAQGLWRLAAVSGGRPVTVFGECGHRGFTPHTVWGEAQDTRGVAL